MNKYGCWGETYSEQQNNKTQKMKKRKKRKKSAERSNTFTQKSCKNNFILMIF